MPGPVDLHAHSTASDGSLPPREVVRLAHAAGLAALALTDHDTTAGLPDALDEGRRLGIEVIPGIELSAAHRHGELHLLGYFIDPASEALREALARTLRYRARRNALIVERLNDLGCALTLAEVQQEAGPGATVGRPHIASVLVRKGHARNIQDAFDRYLAEGAAANVPKENLSPAAAIRVVHDAGGLAVLAHPFTLAAPSRGALLERLARDGLDGVEVLYPKHDEVLRRNLATQAEALGLFITGGSDFHGERKPETRIGTGIGNNTHVPYAVLQRMKDALAARRRA